MPRLGQRETHPAAIRIALIREWLNLSGFPSLRKAASVLRVKQPSVTRWLSGENEPSDKHLGIMAGFLCERETGSVWAGRPAEYMIGFAAVHSGVPEERICALSLFQRTRPYRDSAAAKQALWRLYELCVAVSLGYELSIVNKIDWTRRQINQYERPKWRYYRLEHGQKVGVWLPPSFLELLGPVTSAPTDKSSAPPTDGPGHSPPASRFPTIAKALSR